MSEARSSPSQRASSCGAARTAKPRKLYEKAATEAERAMALVPPERKVTFGVIAMLAHRLWRRARRHDAAARVATAIRGSPELFPITVTARAAHQGPRSPAPESPQYPAVVREAVRKTASLVLEPRGNHGITPRPRNSGLPLRCKSHDLIQRATSDQLRFTDLVRPTAAQR